MDSDQRLIDMWVHEIWVKNTVGYIKQICPDWDFVGYAGDSLAFFMPVHIKKINYDIHITGTAKEVFMEGD